MPKIHQVLRTASSLCASALVIATVFEFDSKNNHVNSIKEQIKSKVSSAEFQQMEAKNSKFMQSMASEAISWQHALDSLNSRAAVNQAILNTRSAVLDSIKHIK